MIAVITPKENFGGDEMVLEFEVPPNRRPECPSFSGLCLLCTLHQIFVLGYQNASLRTTAEIGYLMVCTYCSTVGQNH